MKPGESPDHYRSAARVLALALPADGRLSSGEREALQSRHHELRRLGVAPELLDLEVQSCAAWLLVARDPDWEGPCLPGPQALRDVLAEIGDRDDRHRLFRFCADLADSDGEPSEGESRLLAATLEQMGIHRGMLALDEAGRSLALGRA
ncbi:MAG: hypothetical protein ACK59Y_03525 [Betaproteobacteria bacterium]|nr:hypothetical protein [Betaproteobacteria bacterium]